MKRVANKAYIHVSALGELPQGLRRRVDVAAARVPKGWSLARIDLKGRGVMLGWTESWETEAHPQLLVSRLVIPGKGVKVTDYRKRGSRPVYHRKESMVSKDHPQRAEFAALSAAEAKVGLLGRSDIGGTKAWARALKTAGYKVVGHELVKVGKGRGAVRDNLTRTIRGRDDGEDFFVKYSVVPAEEACVDLSWALTQPMGPDELGVDYGDLVLLISFVQIPQIRSGYGWGRRFVTAAEKWGREQGARVAALYASPTSASWTHPRGFWEATGYRAVAGLQGLGGKDAIMVKTLEPRKGRSSRRRGRGAQRTGTRIRGGKLFGPKVAFDAYMTTLGGAISDVDESIAAFDEELFVERMPPGFSGDEPALYITLLNVPKKARGRGWGRRFARTLENHGRARGAQAVVLLAASVDDQGPSYDFWTKQGFEVLAETEDGWGDPVAAMWKRLEPAIEAGRGARLPVPLIHPDRRTPRQRRGRGAIKRQNKLVIVDVQPEYAAWIHFDIADLVALAGDYDEVLWLFNGPELGHGDVDNLRYWLEEEGGDEYLIRGDGPVAFGAKTYGFLRDVMEALPRDQIEAIGRSMVKYDVSDWRELPRMVQVRHGLDEGFVDEHGCSFAFVDVGGRSHDLGPYLKRFQGADIAGGAEYECLDEVCLLASFYGVTFRPLHRFIY